MTGLFCFAFSFWGSQQWLHVEPAAFITPLLTFVCSASSNEEKAHRLLKFRQTVPTIAMHCRHREVTHDSAAVLHYTYNRFADLKARRDRCDCAPTEADAKRCFILPFDRLVGPWVFTTGFHAVSPLAFGACARAGCTSWSHPHRRDPPAQYGS